MSNPAYRETGDHRIEGTVVSIRMAGHFPICEVQCEAQHSVKRDGEGEWFAPRTVQARPCKRLVDEGDVEFKPGDVVALLAPLEEAPHRTLTIIHRVVRGR